MAGKDNTQYDLYYYNGRGLAEPIRMILSYGGAKFDDKRAPITSFTPITPLPAGWAQRALFGQVPILEFEGKQLTQSLAITRYLARRYNLVGKDDFEAAKCDELVDGVRDFFGLWAPSYRENDPEKKQEIYKSAMAASKERYLPKFAAVLEANGGSFLVGDQLTWADILVAHFFDLVPHVTKVNVLEDYPTLRAFVDRVLSTPGIKEWIANRPETPV